jgi:hypothetical protein
MKRLVEMVFANSFFFFGGGGGGRRFGHACVNDYERVYTSSLVSPCRILVVPILMDLKFDVFEFEPYDLLHL